MDYKNKYEQALEKARIWKDKSGMPKDKQSILDDIFPELAESEDERIRKELIEHCRNTRCVTEEGAERIAKWITWLEKQGQVRCTGIGKKEETGTLKKMLDDEEMKTLLRTEYEKGKADAIAEMQKSWSEGDKEILDGIIVDVEALKEQTITKDGRATYQREIDFLKSLKNRMQPQQEKEEILKKLEEWLDEYISNLADVGTDTLIGSFRKYLDGKLPVKPKSQWKPSEELLDVFIKNAIDFFESNFNPLTEGGVIGAFDGKEKMIEEFKEYMKEEGFNEEWI